MRAVVAASAAAAGAEACSTRVGDGNVARTHGRVCVVCWVLPDVVSGEFCLGGGYARSAEGAFVCVGVRAAVLA